MESLKVVTASSTLSSAWWLCPGLLLKKDGAGKACELVPSPFVKGKLLLWLALFVKGLCSAEALESGVPNKFGIPLLLTETSLTSLFRPLLVAFSSGALSSGGGSAKVRHGLFFCWILSTTSWSWRNSEPFSLLAHCLKSLPASLLKWKSTAVILSTRIPTQTAPLHLVSFRAPSCSRVAKMAFLRQAVWISHLLSRSSKALIRGSSTISPLGSGLWLLDMLSYFPRFCKRPLLLLKAFMSRSSSTAGFTVWRYPPLASIFLLSRKMEANQSSFCQERWRPTKLIFLLSRKMKPTKLHPFCQRSAEKQC